MEDLSSLILNIGDKWDYIQQVYDAVA